MILASRCHMLASRCFPNRRLPPTQLLTPAFNSPADTNDPANVRPWRSRRGPEEEIPDSYAPRARRPRVNFHFQKWRRERERSQSRIYKRPRTHSRIWLDLLSEEILSNHLLRIRFEWRDHRKNNKFFIFTEINTLSNIKCDMKWLFLLYNNNYIIKSIWLFLLYNKNN